MELYHLVNGRRPLALDPQAPLPPDGIVWADFVREQAREWPALVESPTFVSEARSKIVSSPIGDR